ncbi:hypothetical protein [Megasphaera sp.]
MIAFATLVVLIISATKR